MYEILAIAIISAPRNAVDIFKSSENKSRTIDLNSVEFMLSVR